MTLLQFAIGVLNDLVDAPRDARTRLDKPIPAGLVGARAASVLVGCCALLGVILALSVGPGLAALAVAVLAIGFAYDLRAKGTALSWLPFAAGIPLLPVYGWYGAAGRLPESFLLLVPAAMLAGAALAVANAVVDVERDRAAGIGSVAVAIGPAMAARLALAGWIVVAGLAIASLLAGGAAPAWLLATAVAAGVPLAGAALSVRAVGRAPRARELAWATMAVGAGLLAVAWLAGTATGGGPG